jgi:hypothetical protein
MAMRRTYTGGCHCGQVRYEVTTDLSSVVACNCSICVKRGLLWNFVTPDCFKLRAGEGDLEDYQFNQKIIHHYFCRCCGVESFAQGVAPSGEDMVAINVRCLDDVDVASLKPTPFDGRSL